MKPEEIQTPNVLNETRNSVAEHEVFLSFNSDWQAAAFQDWLNSVGFQNFKRWAAARKDEYNA